MVEPADHFLRSYEAATDRRVENLELWELVAAAGIMPDPTQMVVVLLCGRRYLEHA